MCEYNAVVEMTIALSISAEQGLRCSRSNTSSTTEMATKMATSLDQPHQ